eukprot:COSAG01_NODE_67886_length_265_cov_1.903614_2_plen_63_part_01
MQLRSRIQLILAHWIIVYRCAAATRNRTPVHCNSQCSSQPGSLSSSQQSSSLQQVDLGRLSIL